MNHKSYDTLEEAFQPFATNPEYQAAYRRQKPYYDLVRKIIELRTALGITQKALAKKAGTFQSRISKIETAEHDIRLSTLIQIAEALDSDVSIELEPRYPENVMVGAFFSRNENFKGVSYTASDTQEPYVSLREHDGALK